MASVFTNKMGLVNVVKLYGDGSSVIGQMIPVANLPVMGFAGQKFGSPIGLIQKVASGNYTCDVLLGSGNTPVRFYPFQLYVNFTDATGINFGYPTNPNFQNGSGGFFTAGHYGLYGINGNVENQSKGSGMDYIDSAGNITYFSRKIVE